MIKGGYKIIDFKGVSLSDSAETLDGMFNKIVDDYNKPILLSGVSINGEIKDDAYASIDIKVAGDLSKSVELTVYGGVITVTEDDEVTFVLSKSNAELAGDINSITSFLTKKSKTLSFGDISAKNYAEVTDSTLVDKLIVGYQLFGVGAYNVSLLALNSDETGVLARLRNNDEQTLTGASINIQYIG